MLLQGNFVAVAAAGVEGGVAVIIENDRTLCMTINYVHTGHRRGRSACQDNHRSIILHPVIAAYTHCNHTSHTSITHYRHNAHTSYY